MKYAVLVYIIKWLCIIITLKLILYYFLNSFLNKILILMCILDRNSNYKVYLSCPYSQQFYKILK